MFDQALIDAYVGAGWWGTHALADVVAGHAAARPDAPAYIVAGDGPPGVLTWSRYHERSSVLAAQLVQAGLAPGTRLGVLLPDGATVHVAFLAAEKAGLVVAGIGARAGEAEISYLLNRCGATVLLTQKSWHRRDAGALVTSLRAGGLPGLRHIVVPNVLDRPRVLDRPEVLDRPGVQDQPGIASVPVLVDGLQLEAPDPAQVAELLEGRALGPDDLFMINTTSGTTGLPKCVLHTENRWFYFHQLATEAGALTSDDVFFGAVPAPFGFGLWTAHFSPAVLGCPTVVAERFEAAAALRAVAAFGVSVLACVSTQFIMMLNSPALGDVDLSSLRVMFTGGEAVPFARAAAFEDHTGAKVLQFYGSNETGALSGTALTDSRGRRLGTAGRVIDAMQVRVYDERGALLTQPPLVGIPACKGPATCAGYLDDDVANTALFTEDGWMRMGDLVEVDGDGYLRVIGRTSDIIIRGGKNISAPALEAEIAEHPDVDLVAAVAMPDEVFGERVCVYVTTRRGVPLALADLVAFLEARGVGREQLPERLIQLDELPRSSGDKVAKGELRDDIRRRLAAE
jgi:acyl-CoA synthetase